MTNTKAKDQNPSGDKSPKHTATLYPVGRCNNCLWYYHAEDDEKTGLECPNCKTDRHLMDMPEIVRAVNSHEALVEALELAFEALSCTKGFFVNPLAKKISDAINLANDSLKQAEI